MDSALKIAVVIPCHRVRRHVQGVIAGIGPEVARIYVVDDACPEQSGQLVRDECRDPRVVVIVNERNLGVGGATLRGYRRAIDDGMDIIVKMDGDGQMDPAMLARLVRPIAAGIADYSKGNRFFDLRGVQQMPWLRTFGNAALSLLSKLSSGYWNLFDPTNGYTAIDSLTAAKLPFEKISQRYFFESDMLFRLNLARAVVVDVPMDAHYGDEESSLRIARALFEFAGKHVLNFLKRIFYGYYLRDMSVASFELVFGLILTVFGAVFGSLSWIHAASLHTTASAGTVMLAALPLLVGLQLLLAFLNFDIAAVPRVPLQQLLRDHPQHQAGSMPRAEPVSHP
ncbi:MAG TPA: glycosyltransferase family 2 protein [Xanthomonadaceae bacterium]|jgi:glycosyltransferase involved in cell wall biosynthesis